MSKMKTSISLEHETYNKANKVRKIMGIYKFSDFCEYVIKKYCSDPEEIIKEKMKTHQQKLMYYSDILKSIEEQKIEVTVKEQPEKKLTERQF